jgi:flagellar biosynthetic protein FliP
MEGKMLETLTALCVVVGAIIALRGVLLRAAGRRFSDASKIRLLESLSLGAKQQVHLVEVEGRRLLLGTSDSGVTRLARLPDREADPVEASPSVDGEAPASGRAGGARLRLLRSVLGAVMLVGLLGSIPAFAQAVDDASASSGPATLSLSIDGATAPDKLSDTMKIVLVLTAISIAPSILLMATCFTRVLIVLALLRQAIGTATLPPNQVLVGLALMTTLYVMTPVGEVVYADSIQPYMAEEIGGEAAFEAGLAPIRTFLLDHTREEDLLLFVEMKGGRMPTEAEAVPMQVLMPAFMISELRAAFEIGFMIYLPFLVVDLVIASMLISLGMIMLPPVMIALPFKLMLFVLVDGWNLTLSALVSGLQ